MFIFKYFTSSKVSGNFLLSVSGSLMTRRLANIDNTPQTKSGIDLPNTDYDINYNGNLLVVYW